MIFVLPCCPSLHSSKYFFPHRLLFQFICHSQPVVLGRLSLSMCIWCKHNISFKMRCKFILFLRMQKSFPVLLCIKKKVEQKFPPFLKYRATLWWNCQARWSPWSISEMEEKPSMSSLNICLEACCRSGGGGLSNASPQRVFNYLQDPPFCCTSWTFFVLNLRVQRRPVMSSSSILFGVERKLARDW